MLGSGLELVGIFRLFPSVRYCILPGVVWCGAVHTFSHTLTLRRSDRIITVPNVGGYGSDIISNILNEPSRAVKDHEVCYEDRMPNRNKAR